jgi:hypothetical protein
MFLRTADTAHFSLMKWFSSGAAAYSAASLTHTDGRPADNCGKMLTFAIHL